MTKNLTVKNTKENLIMKKIKKAFTAAAAMSAIFLTACFPSGTESSKSNYSEPDIGSTVYDSNLTVEPNIVYPERTAYSNVSFTLKKWDNGIIEKAFCTDKNIVSTDESPSDIDASRVSEMLRLDDDSTIIYEDGYISYFSEECSEYDYSLLIDCVDSGNYSKYFSADSINNTDREKSIQTISDTVKKLGIENLSKPQIYAMEASSMNELMNELGLDELTEMKDTEEHTWTEEQNAYAVCWSFEFDELKINENGSQSTMSGKACDGLFVKGVVQNDRLIYLNVSSAPEIKEISEKNNICTAEAALQTALDDYKDVVLTNPVEIAQCSLLYTPFAVSEGKEYILKPYWQITAAESAEGGKYYNYILIDAVTGEKYY